MSSNPTSHWCTFCLRAAEESVWILFFFAFHNLPVCLPGRLLTSCHAGAPVNTLPSAGRRGKKQPTSPMIHLLSLQQPHCDSFAAYQSTHPFPPLLAHWLASYVLLKNSKYTQVESTLRSGGQQLCSCQLKGGGRFLISASSVWGHRWGLPAGCSSEDTVCTVLVI